MDASKLKIYEETGELVQVTGAMTAAVRREQAEKQAADQALQKSIDHTADELVRHGRIAESDRAKFASIARDPAALLSVLANTADPGRVIGPRSVGRPAGGPKEASAPARVGLSYPAMRSRARDGADEAWDRELGLNGSH